MTDIQQNNPLGINLTVPFTVPCTVIELALTVLKENLLISVNFFVCASKMPNLEFRKTKCKSLEILRKSVFTIMRKSTQ